MAATEAESLPSYSLPAERVAEIALPASWPCEVTPEWAWGGSTGAGVRVCVLDSGVDAGLERVGRVKRSVVVEADEDGNARVIEDSEGDVFGHGTACAGIIRSIAPEVEMTSVRVLGPNNRGSGELMMAGLGWALEQGHQVVNMSLSTLQDRAARRVAPARRRGLLPASDDRRLRPQRRRRQLPLALCLGDLGRQPRGPRPDALLLQPRPAGRVLRSRARHRGGLARGGDGAHLAATALPPRISAASVP